MRYQERGLVQNKEHKHSSHVTKSSTKSSKARMALHSKFIFILKKFYLMLGPHQSPIHFEWINFVNSITKKYENKFTLVSKPFKNRKCENGLPERKWQPILLKEMRFLGPKKSKVERLKNWNYLRIENLKNKIVRKLEVGGLFLKSKMKQWLKDMWP